VALKAQEMAVAKLSLKVYKQNHRALALFARYGFKIVEDGHAELFRMIAAVDDVLRGGVV
jgi:ribosomal protein S18 acetylase RimI-like enzyme